MTVHELLSLLDEIILGNFGNFTEAIETPKGREIMAELLAEENRQALREYFNAGAELNSLASDVKSWLEQRLGECL